MCNMPEEEEEIVGIMVEIMDVNVTLRRIGEKLPSKTFDIDDRNEVSKCFLELADAFERLDLRLNEMLKTRKTRDKRMDEMLAIMKG